MEGQIGHWDTLQACPARIADAECPCSPANAVGSILRPSSHTICQKLPVELQQVQRCRPNPVNLPGPDRTFSLLHWRRLAGPGAFDFKQGDGNGTLFWDVVRSFIHHPTAEQTACHHPKPVLLDTGNINFPYPW